MESKTKFLSEEVLKSTGVEFTTEPSSDIAQDLMIEQALKVFPNADNVVSTMSRQELEGTSLSDIVKFVNETPSVEQPFTGYEINGVPVPKYLFDIDTERVNQIIFLAVRVKTLEEQNTKIIAALKHMGFDTNKHFR